MRAQRVFKLMGGYICVFTRKNREERMGKWLLLRRDGNKQREREGIYFRMPYVRLFSLFYIHTHLEPHKLELLNEKKKTIIHTQRKRYELISEVLFLYFNEKEKCFLCFENKNETLYKDKTVLLDARVRLFANKYNWPHWKSL